MESGWSTSGFSLEDLHEMAAIAEQGGFDFYAHLIARAPGHGHAGAEAVLAREFLEPLEKVYSSGGISDSDTALSFGCMLEEKSIGFYAALRASVGSGELAGLDRIIAQEEGHRKTLELLRS